MNPAKNLRATIIIPTLDRLTPLKDLLNDLARCHPEEVEIIIAWQSRSNAEPPLDIIDSPLRNGFQVRWLQLSPGVVAARNFCAKQSKGEVLIFLDDDLRIADPSFISQHLSNYQDPEIAGVCGQELTGPDFRPSAEFKGAFETVYAAAEFFPRSSSGRFEVPHLCTCNCSVRREQFLATGGFDSRFRGNSYGDDTDLAIRMHTLGQRIVFDPLCSAKHLHWKSGGLRLSDSDNRFSEADRYLSSWLLYYRHVPVRWKRWFIWNRIVRKSLLLRRNALAFHRWPFIVKGLVEARREALSLLQTSA